ncbi:CinA family protein [Novosphingobium taihuense]|uniref:PncC family amidohydrolase n=1 Tax=Novosphingobium taihuense TaxID=260085 RepID=A0A7W7EU21_9SPHN|nr:CinA family protein [Novosphingobium taihuense]MBB4613624.1 PncC family amidohydrolase [Novosphingobium taihuense]TWH81133.1 competence/damage-inducible protein cinA [Novosphingobium taihuense]
MLEHLAAIGAEAGAMLKARKQTIAVVDGSTGGLISASLLAMPGASAFYLGGGVIYTLKGRRIVLGHAPGSLRGYSSAQEDYALAQARLIRERYSADWGIAETGASGGSSHPRGVASGTSAIGVVGPGGHEASVRILTESDDRLANMQAFTAAALGLLRDSLASHSGT